MTYAEVIKHIKRLPLSEQQAIYRELQRTLKNAPRKPVKYNAGVFEPKKDSSLFKVLGALREEGKPAPTDEEAKQMVSNYLLEKYS